MLTGGARWASTAATARRPISRSSRNTAAWQTHTPWVSQRARRRQQDEMGTLGSGNHYLEVQRVVEIYDPRVADVFGLRRDDDRRVHSLWVAGARASDRHRVPEGNGDRWAVAWR